MNYFTMVLLIFIIHVGTTNSLSAKTLEGDYSKVVASSFLERHGAERAFDLANHPDSFWEANTGFPIWLRVDYKDSKKILGFVLWSGEDSSRMPKAWTVQGSDEGKTWIDLDSIHNQTDWKPGEKRTYSLKNSSAYKYWRINFTEGNDRIFRVYDIEPLFEVPVANGDRADALHTSVVGKNQGYAVLSSSFLAPHGPNRAFDLSNEPDSFWEAKTGFPIWLKVDYKVSRKILGFILWSGEDASRMPKAWTVQGSNDDTFWVDLDNVQGQVGWKAGEKRVFIFKNSVSYRYWRINFLEGNHLVLRVYDIEPLMAGSSVLDNILINAPALLVVLLVIIGVIFFVKPFRVRLKSALPFKKIWPVFGLVVLIGFFVEAGFRIYLERNPEFAFVERWTYRSNRPPAYENAGYFSKEFIEESSACGKLFISPGNDFIQMHDQQGKYCNIINGLRKTTEQPVNHEKRLMLFGGSTIFCQEVPDGFTVPSYLQGIVNKENLPVKVENYGVNSLTAVEQLNMLKTRTVNAGDIVVFYDGLNEIIYPVYNAELHGWRPDQIVDGGGSELSAYQQLIRFYATKYASRIKSVHYLANPLEWRLPVNVKNKKIMAKILAVEKANYQRVIVEANRYVVAHGAVFYHFLQPYMFTLNKLTDNERWIMGNDLKALPGLDRAFASGFPVLREAIGLAEREGVKTIDMTHAFDGRTSEIFLDTLHVNHVANEIIAQSLYQHIFAGK